MDGGCGTQHNLWGRLPPTSDTGLLFLEGSGVPRRPRRELSFQEAKRGRRRCHVQPSETPQCWHQGRTVTGGGPAAACHQHVSSRVDAKDLVPLWIRRQPHPPAPAFAGWRSWETCERDARSPGRKQRLSGFKDEAGFKGDTAPCACEQLRAPPPRAASPGLLSSGARRGDQRLLTLLI